MYQAGYHRAEIRKDALLHRYFLITIIILRSSADSFTVSIPANRLVVARGYSAVLECVFSPNFRENTKLDISSLVVTWQRQEDNRVVHSYYHERDQLANQDPAYRNRTALFEAELRSGNASVRIANVGVHDAGGYLCTVGTSQGTDKAYMQVDYGAFYTEPRLTIDVHSSDVVVQYETAGYPAPEVMWEGERGKNLSNHIQTSMELDEEMGLYHITSSYTASNAPLNFTFILENQLLHQYLQRPISYTGGHKSCVNEDVALAFISVLLFMATAALVWLYYKKKKDIERKDIERKDIERKDIERKGIERKETEKKETVLFLEHI